MLLQKIKLQLGWQPVAEHCRAEGCSSCHGNWGFMWNNFPVSGRKAKWVYLYCNKYLTGGKKLTLEKNPWSSKNLPKMPNWLAAALVSHLLCSFSLYIFPSLYYMLFPLKNGKSWHWRSMAEELSHVWAIVTDQLWLLALSSDFLEGPLCDTLWVPFLSPVSLTFSISRAPKVSSRKERMEKEGIPNMYSFVNFCRCVYYI